MNTIRARLSTSTHVAFAPLMKRASPSQPSLARFAHTSSTTPEAVPMMKPVFVTVSIAVGAGVAYALSRSTGRIGSRFEAREKTLDRTKWLREGGPLDDKWLN
ncbi:hypothetical protein DV736_g1933, partial [Chaetothyriales sp. CBS 134916]